MIERCADAGVNPGYALGRDYEEHADGLLVAITEQRTREHIDRLAEVLGARRRRPERALRRREADGGIEHASPTPRRERRCSASARDDLREGRAGPPRVRRARARRARARRRRAAARRACAAPSRRGCREVSEPEIVRHYVRLSQAQLRPRLGLLSARLVHDEAQPAPARARRRAARPRAAAPAAGPERARRARSS